MVRFCGGITIEAGIWLTKSDASRHQNGDEIFALGFSSWELRDTAWDDYVACHIRGESQKIKSPTYCANISKIPPDKKTNTDGRYTIIPRALQTTDDRRWGFNLSNKFQLHPALDLTVSGDFTREKFTQWNAAEAAGTDRAETTFGAHYFSPRAGRREQYNLAFNLNWMATPWLQLSAGYRYTDYWAHDDKTTKMRAKRDAWYKIRTPVTHRRFAYQEILSDADAAAREYFLRDDYYEFLSDLQYNPDRLADFLADSPTVDDYINQSKEDGVFYGERKEILIPYTGSHKGFAANNPFLNGTFNKDELIATAQSPDGVARKYTKPVGQGLIYGKEPSDPWKAPEKMRGHAWMPQLGLTLFPTNNTRVYVRYSEFARFPSLFESTQIVRGGYGITNATTSPEWAYNWEIGYAHDLSSYFPNLHYMDFRINYFNNTIKDYMDRDYNFQITHFDKKKLSGIELQTRIDSGKYFASFGGSYRLEQKMCDKDYASFIDPIDNRVPACVDGGFPSTFARTSLQPKYSLNLDVGTRLMNQKLEIGSRMTYHSSYENKSEKKMGAGATFYTHIRPHFWNPIWVFDAYASYRVTDRLNIDFGINNITNRYYIDPMARVPQPAQGRTLKLGLTARF